MRIHMNKIITRCLAALAAGMIAVSTLAGSGIMTQAADSKTGTLTITPKCSGEVVDTSSYDGTFKVYKVADYDGNGTFTVTADFQFENHETLLTGDNLSNERQFNEITQTVTAWVTSHADIETTLSGVKAGTSNQLAYGLYLIMQDQSATGYTDTTPFLVMIPTYEDGQTQTAVTAYPKISKTDTPSTPPETPDKPHKPHDDTPPTTPTKTGKVALGKSDSVTGETLEGVVFTLYKADGTAIGTYTTDADGVIYVDNLSYGQYYFVETQALPNYIEDKTPQTFEIAGEDTVLLTMTNTPVSTPTEEETPHGYTGDESNMALYGIVVGVAAIALIGWFIWNKRSKKEQ